MTVVVAVLAVLAVRVYTVQIVYQPASSEQTVLCVPHIRPVVFAVAGLILMFSDISLSLCMHG